MNQLPKNCFSCDKKSVNEDCGSDYGDIGCKKIHGIIDVVDPTIIFKSESPEIAGEYLFLSDKFKEISVVTLEDKDIEKQKKDPKYLSGGKWCKVAKIEW